MVSSQSVHLAQPPGTKGEGCGSHWEEANRVGKWCGGRRLRKLVPTPYVSMALSAAPFPETLLVAWFPS